jgi:omega-amidase
MAEQLRIGMIQADIVWEQKEANFALYERLLGKLAGKADLVVMPEMFATGFTMNASAMGETNDGVTMQHVSEWAKRYGTAISGSFIAIGGEQYFNYNGHCSIDIASSKSDASESLVNVREQYFNRAFFAKPDGSVSFYDKRHLFRMAQEDRYFASGDKQLIVEYQGWKICLQVCYDLRFPVWSRNTDNSYDLLIYVANWPEARRNAWISLLQARAIENLSYVCGVNRAGTNGSGIVFHGDSMIFSYKGERLANLGKRANSVSVITLEKASLERFRKKFPAWMDADRFTIER